MFENRDVLIAFSLTLAAGLATALGSALAFFSKTSNERMLALGLSFSAGAMIFVSFMEIIPKATDYIGEAAGASAGWLVLGGFAVGVLVIAGFDRLIPKSENPHEPHRIEEIGSTEAQRQIKMKGLKRIGILTALGIALHNFPEGLATFLAALEDPRVGVTIAIAIALHNIPEGISVAVPMYYATGSRFKACMYSALSGLAEPVGAIVGFLIFGPFLSPLVFGFLFAFVAGVMVFISLDELLPTAKLFDKGHDTVYGVVGGMFLMGMSLELLR